MSDGQLNANVDQYLQAAAMNTLPPTIVSDPLVIGVTPIEQLLRVLGVAANIGDPNDNTKSIEQHAERELKTTEAAQKFAAQDEAAAAELNAITGKPDTEDTGVSYNNVVAATAEGAKAEAKEAGKFNKAELDDLVRNEPKAGIDGPLAKADLEDVVDRATGIGKFAKFTSNAANVAEVFDGIKKGFAQVDDGAAPITAAIDQGARTGGGLLAGAVGAEGGAALGGMVGTVLIPIPGVGSAIGAGFGAVAGSLLASDAGKAAGEAFAAGIHSFAAAGSFTEAWSTVPGTLGNVTTKALDAIGADVTGSVKNVLGLFGVG